MFEWVKHFLLLPLSLLAAFATIFYLAAEVLTLTVWGLILKTRKAAHEYFKLVRGPEKTEISVSTILICVAVGVGVYYLTKSKGDKV